MNTDGIRLYAGTAGHSAWFSNDLGESWTHPNSHSGMYTEARVWCMSSHPSDPDVLWAGSDMGLFRWLESTARWEPMPSPMQDVWAIAQDPENPSLMIAGTRPGGLYRSTDAGVTWTVANVPGVRTFSEINKGPTRVTQILFDPVDRGVIWAGIEIGGIYRSTDGGLNWALREDGLVSADVHGIAVLRDETGAKHLLATTNKGLHRSTDDGAHWVHEPIDSPWQYVRGVTVAADGRTVFLTNGNGPPGATGRLLRSRDAGRHWDELALPGPLNSTVWCVATHPADPDLLFTCTNLGQVFRSTDGGSSWSRLPREFGEIRTLHWRPAAGAAQQAKHATWSYT